jgi:hypothetical protein
MSYGRFITEHYEDEISKLTSVIAEKEKPIYFTEPITEDPIFLGRNAADALENPAIAYAFTKIENELTRAWKTSAPKDNEAREHLYYRLEGLAHLKMKLLAMVNYMILEGKKQERQADKKAA